MDEEEVTCTHPRLYWCPQACELECPDCGGFDTCCLHPERHIPYYDYKAR